MIQRSFQQQRIHLIQTLSISLVKANVFSGTIFPLIGCMQCGKTLHEPIRKSVCALVFVCIHLFTKITSFASCFIWNWGFVVHLVMSINWHYWLCCLYLQSNSRISWMMLLVFVVLLIRSSSCRQCERQF